VFFVEEPEFLIEGYSAGVIKCGWLRNVGATGLTAAEQCCTECSCGCPPSHHDKAGARTRV
jgi:hypothetical protein